MKPDRHGSVVGIVAVVFGAAILMTWIGTGNATPEVAHAAPAIVANSSTSATPDTLSASPSLLDVSSGQQVHTAAAATVATGDTASAASPAGSTGDAGAPPATAHPTGSVAASARTLTPTATGVAPTAADHSYTTTAGTTLKVAAPGVLKNATGPANITLEAIIDHAPAGAVLSMTFGGQIWLTPKDSTFTGDITFTYKVRAGTAATDPVSAPATVTVTVVAAATGGGGNGGGGNGGNGLNGAAIYAKCSGCHGVTGGGTAGVPALTSATSALVVSKVTTGSMKGYAGALSNAEVRALADYILAGFPLPATGGGGGNGGGGGGTTPTGPVATFNSFCASCHGVDGSGTASGPAIAGESRGEILTVVRTGDGAMPGFPAATISDADLADLASYVSAGLPPAAPASGDTAPPLSPAARFNSFCASCHGVDGSGTASGPAIAGESRGEILTVVRTGDGAMPGFPAAAISDVDLADLASYVSNTLAGGHVEESTEPRSSDETKSSDSEASTAPADGLVIYRSTCAFCHGPDGNGTSVAPRVLGESFRDVIKAVRYGEDSMPAFPVVAISDADLNVLAGWLSGETGTNGEDGNHGKRDHHDGKSDGGDSHD